MSTLTILLVDDEPFLRRSLEKTLRRAGFDVLTAGDCSEGWAKFQAAEQSGAPVALALLDLNMPGFDGASAPNADLQLLDRLLVHRPTLPAIVLTAYDEAETPKAALQHGARDYCVKGREQKLVEQVQAVLATP